MSGELGFEVHLDLPYDAAVEKLEENQAIAEVARDARAKLENVAELRIAD